MRLWTAMLGAWLAAGSSAAADGGGTPDRARPAGGPQPVPVAERVASPEAPPAPATPPARAG